MGIGFINENVLMILKQLGTDMINRTQMIYIKSGLITLFTFLLQTYFIFGRSIFFSFYKLGLIIVPVIIIILILFFANCKIIRYEFTETGISYKKRCVNFNEINYLETRKAGKGYNVLLNELFKKNSLIIPCENREEMEKVKKLILNKSNPGKVKETGYDIRWILQIPTIIAFVLFIFSFTWETNLKPNEFQHNVYSQANFSTQDFSFHVEDVIFDDMLNPCNHYILTTKGKIYFQQLISPKYNVLEYIAFVFNPINMEKERQPFPVIDYYKRNFEGFLLRYLKKIDIQNYSPRLFISNSTEAILLNYPNSKKLILRKRKTRDILDIELSNEFNDDDVLKILESVEFFNEITRRKQKEKVERVC
ncbi:MAG: hypothetical protein K8S23_05395 [Candidatus Cloacimonetes bacterium]|nr:hypothetical protein [Candidatus Cloacimonadota bacterium]